MQRRAPLINGVRQAVQEETDRLAPRSRPVYLLLLAITVTLGLASRQFAAEIPRFIARYAGDALWASMVTWMLALLWRRASTRRVALSALVIALTIEVTQLYHASWIDAVRASRLGALVLGQGFLWSDLACYAIGVALAALLDHWIPRREYPGGHGEMAGAMRPR